jgi:hypothetical protein
MHVFHVGFEKSGPTFNFYLTVFISLFNKLIEWLSAYELLNEVYIVVIVYLALQWAISKVTFEIKEVFLG